MASLTDILSEKTGRAFESVGLPSDLGLVRVSDRPDLAQFQCNGAMAAAKLAKKAPRMVAEDLVKVLADDSDLSTVEIAGPGFININVTDAFLQNHLQEVAADDKLGLVQSGAGQKVVLDYGQPNVAKPMHVGHLRSSIIGESLKRILRSSGYETIGDIHLGDWGTHMGMVVSEYIKRGEVERVLKTDVEDSAAVDALLDELSVIYPSVSKLCKSDPERQEEARAATVKIQNKETPYYELWQVLRDVSVIAQKKNFEALDVYFDLWWGESTAHDTIAPMVEKLQEQGLAVVDDGATVMYVAEDDDNKEVPPLILYKSDGAVMYGTTDLACLVDRMHELHPNKILYVVDQRQHLHFEQVFRAARKAHIVPDDVELTHIGFGTMNGTDGKPFKTREGGVMKLEDLIQLGIEKAQDRLKEADLAKDMDDAEKDDIAHKVAIAAIKFADLQNQRLSDYVFDLDRLTSFEGKTGPYLLYQAVRINSLLSKAADQGAVPGDDYKLLDEDRGLALILSEMPDVFDAASRSYTPHHLCDYAYRLAQEFSRFYSNCHILSEEDDALKQSRLALCALTERTLTKVLDCLGIVVPARM